MEIKNNHETKVEKSYCILIDKTYDNLAWPSHIDEEGMLLYLKTMQHYCNELLRCGGSLTLKEVCLILNVSYKKEWYNVGWMYDEYTFVDFGLDKHLLNPFMHGFDKILLSFNAQELW